MTTEQKTEISDRDFIWRALQKQGEWIKEHDDRIRALERMVEVMRNESEQ